MMSEQKRLEKLKEQIFTPITAKDEISNVEIFPQIYDELLQKTFQLTLLSENGLNAVKDTATLKRTLHTLKGNYRVSGIASAGQIAHRMESIITEWESLKLHEEQPLSQEWDDLFGGELQKIRYLLEFYENGIRPLPEEHRQWLMENAPPPERVSDTPASKRIRFAYSEYLDGWIDDMGEMLASNMQTENELKAMRRELEDFGKHRHYSEKYDPYEFNFLLKRLLKQMENTLNRHEKSNGRQQNRIRQVLTQMFESRMIPLDSHFKRLQETVHDSSLEENKPVVLNVDGGEILWDSQMLSGLLSAFEHILRNAVVHGLETPEERKTQGKAQTGLITLSVQESDSHLVVKIRDDGRGINWDNIRKKALSGGFIQEDEADKVHKLKECLFANGFSSKDKPDGLSGRGIGLDIVRTLISEHGGHIELSSELGKFTEFTLILPIEHMIKRVSLIIQNKDYYAIPSNMIEGVLSYGREEYLNLIKNKEKLSVNGESYPLASLNDILNLPPMQESQNYYKVLLLRYMQQRMALLIDHYDKSAHMPVKPIGNIQKSGGIMGASVISLNQYALVINPVLLMENSLNNDNQTSNQNHAPYCLIVDDSKAVCLIEQNALKKMGIASVSKEDGLSALSYLNENPHHLPKAVLTDYEMPNMNGLELVREMKKNPRLSHIPIAMITSKSLEQYQQTAYQEGVDLVLGKPFNQDTLFQFLKPFFSGSDTVV